jgi:hypothetical protein
VPPVVKLDIDVPQPPIIDPAGDVMAPFYEKLAALMRGRAKDHIRIGVYGDSNMTADWTTGAMRRILQERFGDGGHGFVALGKPWPGYVHMDVRHDLNKFSWMIFAVSTQPVTDGRYGFAGIAVQSMGSQARTWVETALARSPIGKTVSRADVHYLKGPKMGSFDVMLDGKAVAQVDTAGEEFEAAHTVTSFPDAPHRITFSTRDGKPVRLFGVALEREAPSITVDSLGVGASNTMTMMRQEHKIYREAVRNRGYDLVIFLHGTFDVVPWGSYEKHAAWVGDMVKVHRDALPGVPILIMSPADRAPSLGARHSRPEPEECGRQKREIAKAEHCAFWDFREAMGGDLSIVRFYKRKMAFADLIHFTAPGGAYMGSRIVSALFTDFSSYLGKHPEAGCGAARAPAAAQGSTATPL